MLPPSDTSGIPAFASTIVDWQKCHGRHHLPWQDTRDPYRIWLSEIMLQQTQVATVLSYYERFLQRFPSLATLAAAQQEEVMPYWAGLGYYARARNLHRCAQAIAENWNGRFPATVADLATLPGIGRSTAAAIAAFAYGERSPIMDGNVRRVFTRYFGVHGPVNERKTEQALWSLAEEAVRQAPAALDMAAYTQGLMDLGSIVCTRTRPACEQCPVQGDCYAKRESRQHELPTPKKKRDIPERQALMLIVEQDDRILLELQPSPGIWGGLWSLPQYPDADSLEAACSSLGHDFSRAQKMAGLVHTFSHFKLHIEPWYLPSAARGVSELIPTQSWTPLRDLADAALPAPTRKILEGLFAQNGSLPLALTGGPADTG